MNYELNGSTFGWLLHCSIVPPSAYCCIVSMRSRNHSLFCKYDSQLWISCAERRYIGIYNLNFVLRLWIDQLFCDASQNYGPWTECYGLKTSQRPKAHDQWPSNATNYPLLTTNQKLWTMDWMLWTKEPKTILFKQISLLFKQVVW